MKTETRSVFAKNFPTLDEAQNYLTLKTSVLIQTRLRALFRPIQFDRCNKKIFRT